MTVKDSDLQEVADAGYTSPATQNFKSTSGDYVNSVVLATSKKGQSLVNEQTKINTSISDTSPLEFTEGTIFNGSSYKLSDKDCLNNTSLIN